MRLDRRKLLRFVLWFVPIFAAMLAAYPFVIRVYEPAVLRAANGLMHRMEPPTEIATTQQGVWQGYNLERGLRRGFVTWNRGTRELHFLSIALLPALLLATPAPWPVRLRLLAIALPLLFLANTLAMIGITRTHYCFVQDPFKVSCRILLRISNTSGQLFGAALWALLTFRMWFDRGSSLPPPLPAPEEPAPKSSAG